VTLADGRVVIAGGGVAGLAVSNALARRGIRSVVLERRRAPGDIDRGDVIQESVLPILKRWNLSDRLDEYGPIEIRKFRILNGEGNILFAVNLDKDLSIPARLTLVTHPDLERLLERAALDTGMVSLRRETPCTDLLIENGRVVGVRTEAEDVRGDLTIIASGAQAPLRDKYFNGRHLREYAYSFYNARVKALPQFSDAGYYILGPTGVMVIAPLPKGEMRIGIQFRRNGSESITSRNFHEMVARRLPGFPVDRLEFVDGHVYHLTRSLSRCLWIPGAALIGDAAHTVHPAGGQGMNLAFQDAELLASTVGHAGGSSRDIDDACATYSRRRRREIKRVLRVTHFMGSLGAIERPLLMRIRESLIQACNQSTFIKKRFVQRVIDVG
jgi:2-polyprenyl-6-methoxyphenol hydroxylase-like FAD-dependent oxidoreductase